MTHSLVELLQEAGEKVGALADLLNEARKLDLHYIPSRYPNGLPSSYPHQFYSRNIAEEALHAAEKIFKAVVAIGVKGISWGLARYAEIAKIFGTQMTADSYGSKIRKISVN